MPNDADTNPLGFVFRHRLSGFALAARWHGIDTVGFCEIDPWCRRVLTRNFPGVPMHDDLKSLTGETVRGWIALAHADGADGEARRADGVRTGATERKQPARDRGETVTELSDAVRERCEAVQPTEAGYERAGGRTPFDFVGATNRERTGLCLITAGYPCQPFSHAGKRMGAEDDRHLWPFIAALVADIEPRWCLLENVAGHVSLGLDRVLADLEEIGYACWPVVVPACAVNAPHRRDRVWIVAHATDGGIRRRSTPWQSGFAAFGSEVDADTDEAGRRKQRFAFANAPQLVATQRDGEVVFNADEDHGRTPWQAEDQAGTADLPISGSADRIRPDANEAKPGLGQPHDGLSGRLDGRLARPWDGDWEHGIPRVTDGCVDRVHKLKALGNAIVPQVAYELIAAMKEAA